MRVTYSASGELRHYLVRESRAAALEIPSGSKVRELLQQLGVNWNGIGVIAVNGQVASEDTELGEGDHVELLTPLGGG